MTAARRPGDAPPRAYAALTATFTAAAAGGALSIRRAGAPLPERASVGDLALLSAATFKLSRLLSRERVTSFARAPFTTVEPPGPGDEDPVEVPAQGGVRRAVGELLLCPFCLDHWIAMAFVLGFVRAPRATRTVASVYAVTAASDVAQIAWRAADRRA